MVAILPLRENILLTLELKGACSFDALLALTESKPAELLKELNLLFTENQIQIDYQLDSASSYYEMRVSPITEPDPTAAN